MIPAMPNPERGDTLQQRHVAEQLAGGRDTICGRCRVPLELESVPTRYAHGGLLMQLWRCPCCGLTLVPKALAEGYMTDMQRRMEETWHGGGRQC